MMAQNPVPLGHCYQDVFKFILDFMDDSDGKVVHGRVTRKDGKVIAHAWVKLNTGFVWTPPGDFVDGEAFGKVVSSVDAEYTRKEAILLVGRTGCHGPWTESEVQEMRQAASTFAKRKASGMKPK